MTSAIKLARSPTPGELRRRILQLAGPIMLASLSQTLMSLIDIAMVGRLGAAAVAAVGLGGMFTFAISAFLTSIQAGAQTVISRRVGEELPRQVSETVRSAFRFSLLVGTLIGLLTYSVAQRLFPLISDDSAVISMGSAYLEWRSLSLGMVMASSVLYALYNGISRPGIHLVVSLLANSLNVVLNYGLIFGHWGLAAMGAPGAGLATTLSSLVALGLYAGFSRLADIKRNYPGLWRGPGNWKALARVIEISVPAAWQNFGVMIGFVLFMVIMGRVSTMALAATEIVFNILSFSFMPAMGFLYATQTLVSESLGRKDPDTAAQAAKSATVQCMLLMGSMGILFMSVPRIILRLFTPEDELIEMAVSPLVVLGMVQFVDAIGMVHLGALRGASDNRYPAIVDLLLMWLFFLPVTYLTALHYQYGIMGGWIALAIYLAAFAAFTRHRFLTGPWRTIAI